MEKKEGEGQSLPARRESGMAEEWGTDMDLEDEVESCKKLDEQKRKLQKELRDAVKEKEERMLFLSNKVERNKMADAEMAAEL